MPLYPKGNLLSEGKTKRVISVANDKNLVILESKDDITKNDDPSATRVMSNKGRMSNATTCNVFRLLQSAGIPVGFVEQISQTEFVSPTCHMIPLEVVARRYAVGSYLKRFPELEVPGPVPHRFDPIVIELFLKTTGNLARGFNGQTLGQVEVEDPLIINPKENLWILVHPKKPSDHESAKLLLEVSAPDVLLGDTWLSQIIELETRSFLILESAFAKLGLNLIDFKLEFGVTNDNQIVIADVIDNDSWRLRTSEWQELSKQLFRDNHDFSDITEKYEMVAKLTESLSL